MISRRVTGAVRTSSEVGRHVHARLLRVRRRNIPHIEHGIERQGTVLRGWLVDRADGVSELHYEGSELVARTLRSRS
jgi:hypothetical protein